MAKQERSLKRHSNRLAVAKSAKPGKILNGPNLSIHLRCITDSEIKYKPLCAIKQAIKKTRNYHHLLILQL